MISGDADYRRGNARSPDSDGASPYRARTSRNGLPRFDKKRLKPERLDFQRIKTCSTSQGGDIGLSLLLNET
jgi:hypothetical protein